MQFVHLHAHSHYSIGKAVPRVRDLVRKAAEYEMPALALTDSNSVAGLHELAEACREHKVKPILGCEIDVLPSTHTAFQGRTHRMVLLVRDEQGYRNLLELLTLALSRVGDVPPFVSMTDLERRQGGLIYLTGSPRSELYHWLREGDPAETKHCLNRIAAAVGAENLCFEVIDYPHPGVRTVMDYVLEVGRFLNIPVVATQNVRFLEPADMLAYCALVQRPRLSEPRWPLPDEELPTRHFTSAREMERRFGYTPEILEQSLKIAERCDFSLPRTRSRVPAPDLERGQDAPLVLWDAAVRGAAARYGGLSEEVKERLNLEYADLRGARRDDVDLAEYLLLLREISTFLREEGLSRGVGRGALLSSVVAYALGVTQIDPLAYKLEYVSPRSDHESLPLFEMEVSSSAMRRVLDFLRERLGERHVAAVGRRVDWERARLFQDFCAWAGLKHEPLRNFKVERAAPLAEEETGETEDAEDWETAPEKRVPDWEEDIRPSERVDAAQLPILGAEGVPRGKRIRSRQTLAEIVHTLHPCPREFEAERGQFVLSREPIESAVPVVCDEEGQRVCQADGRLIDRLLMPRVEFAASTLLNVLEMAQKAVRQDEDPGFSLSAAPLDDEQTFRLLGMGLTNGIVPLHGITAKSLLRAERPRSIAALAQVILCAAKRRPGADAEATPLQRLESLSDAVLSYWCAHLKVHHPIAFMTAMLTHSLSQRAPRALRPRFQILLREARKMGIEILEPHINLSAYEFTQEGAAVRTGLMVVQGVGERTFQEIDQVRRGMPFMSASNFCRRTDPRRVSQAVIVNLVKAGAFEVFEPNRTRLLHEFERSLKNMRMRSPEGAGDAQAQLHLFEPEVFGDESAATPSRSAPDEEMTDEEIVRYEQEAIGYAISHDITERYEKLMRMARAVSPYEINPRHEGKRICVAGFVDHVERDGLLVKQEGDMALDLEGHVVLAPKLLAPEVVRIQNARSPVMVEGVVRRHSKEECVLEASTLHLLEEIARQAACVAVLCVNLAGENARTASMLLALLKRYGGTTPVEVENARGLSRWTARRVARCRIFVCPGLVQGLRRLLPENRVRFLDESGRPVSPPR